MSNVIQLKQERIPRGIGWQLTQWVSRVPIGATSPDALEPLFVIRNVEGRESFDRIADLTDFVNLSENLLKFFEPKGTYGNEILGQAVNGDLLRISGDSSVQWEQTGAPYNDREFAVYQVISREQGTGISLFVGGRILLTGYSFTNDDVGRWVLLSGFVTGAYNGYFQVVSVSGGMGQLNYAIPSSETSTGVWDFRWVEISQGADVSLEPKYFPQRKTGLTWALYRGLALVTSGTGGSSRRERYNEALFLSVRWTSVEPSLDAALGFMTFVQNGVKRLQAEADANSGTTGEIVVTTFGA